MWIRFFWILFVLNASAQGEDPMVLHLAGADPRQELPFRVGGFLALPEGVMGDVDRYCVLDGRGVACPADLYPTARWADGSVRYLSIRAAVESRRSKKGLQIREGPPQTRSPWSIRCEPSGEFQPVEVDTGPMRILFSPLGKSWMEGLWLNNEPVLASGDALGMRLLLNGTAYLPVLPRRIVVLRGEAECTVSISSRTLSCDSEQGPACEMRFSFSPGSTQVRCHAAVKGNGFQGYSEGISICFKPSRLSERPRFYLLAGGSGSGRVVPCSFPAELLAENSSLNYKECGRTMPFSAVKDAGLYLDQRKSGFGLYLPSFKALHPWSAGYNDLEGMWISMLSKGFYWDRGFVCERDFVFEAGAEAPPRELPPLETAAAGCVAFGLSGMPAYRSYPFAPQEEVAGRDNSFRLLKKVTEQLVNGLKKEREQWDGFRDTGDYRMRHGQFANCEFDPAYGFLKRFLLFKQFDDLVQAEIMINHWLRFDRAGPEEGTGIQGLPWMHGEEHASGEMELGHMWIDGALLHFLIAHDLECRAAALTIGEYIANALPAGNTFILERCVAWSLMALTALVDAGFKEFESSMDGYAALICGRQSSKGFFCFDRVRDNETEYYSPCSWITGGITLEALYRHYKLTGSDDSRQALLRGAQWLMSQARDPLSGTWRTHVRYDTDSGSRVKSLSPPVLGENLALVALGLARSGSISNNKRMLMLARETVYQGLHDLEKGVDEYPGRAFALVMRAAPDVLLATHGMGN